MKLNIFVPLLLSIILPGTLLSTVDGFSIRSTPTPSFFTHKHTPNVGFEHALHSSPTDSDNEEKAKRMGDIFREESMNPANMKASAEAMKNLKTEDIDRMVAEMEQMNPVQLGALKAMGMDPKMMKQTMTMMRDNPQMVESAQKLMESMTPEELQEQSRLAQQKLATVTPEELEQTSKAMSSISTEQLDKTVEVLMDQKAQKKAESDLIDSIAEDMNKGSEDKDVIDSMFRVGELMSDPPTGGCTFAGFTSLPVIQLLSGDREFDLSPSELKECWKDGSLGEVRVDLSGFERVWKEVQDYFEDDIMGEARKEAKKQVSNQESTKSASTAPALDVKDFDAEQMKAVSEQVKNMSDGDVDSILGQMENIDDVQEAQMRKMGVSPEMVKKTAKMMQDNPMMRKAAQTMMKNMSPEQMIKASKQAQEQMAGMSQEEIDRRMEEMNKGK